MRQRAERCQPFRTTETVQENLYARQKIIPQQSPIFQSKARRGRNTGRILEEAGGS